MRLVVTGVAGFIGSNLVTGLNRLGIRNVVAAHDMADGVTFTNLVGGKTADCFDRSEFYARFARNDSATSTPCFTKHLFRLHAARRSVRTGQRLRLLEGPSGRLRAPGNALDLCLVGGGVRRGQPLWSPRRTNPLNVYGRSKLLFDAVVRRHLPHSAQQLFGLRYFDVYGPRQQHKVRKASVAFHYFNEFKAGGTVRLFAEYGGYGAGMQQRDFVFCAAAGAVQTVPRPPGRQVPVPHPGRPDRLARHRLRCGFQRRRQRCRTRRGLGARLLVAANTDASARRLQKGLDRPLNTELDRVVVLAALESVDALMLFDDDTPCQLPQRVSPDPYVKGGDYDMESLEKTRLVRSWGGQAQALTFVDGCSTTALMRRVKAGS